MPQCNCGTWLPDKPLQGSIQCTCGYVYRPTPCPHLGNPRTTRDGISIRVKCTCPNSGGTKEQFHQSHDCHAPEHRRASGGVGACLPSMLKAFDADHATEAGLYCLCVSCGVKPGV